MGKTQEDKQVIVADLKQQLAESQLMIVIDYQGLSVAEVTNLRSQLRPAGATCKVAKNTLMNRAIEGDPNWSALGKFLAGSSAFIFVKEDLSAAIKAYESFQKVAKKTEVRGGVLGGHALSANDVTALRDLPSKEELMAQIAGALQAIPTKLAVGLNQVPTKVAIGINEVPASLGRAIQAIASKDQDQAA